MFEAGLELAIKMPLRPKELKISCKGGITDRHGEEKEKAEAEEKKEADYRKLRSTSFLSRGLFQC